MSKFIYILEKYFFYEGGDVKMASEDYNLVKEYFDEYKIGSGEGLRIVKYEMDKKLQFKDCKSMDWIEIDYNGKVKDLKKIWSNVE